jgi:hypothetical protein
MHYLHTLGWLIDQLTDGNPVAWLFFVGTVFALGIALVHDFRANRKADSQALKRHAPE